MTIKCSFACLWAYLRLLIACQQAVDTSIISSITDAKGEIIHVNRKFCEVSKSITSVLKKTCEWP